MEAPCAAKWTITHGQPVQGNVRPCEKLRRMIMFMACSQVRMHLRVHASAPNVAGDLQVWSGPTPLMCHGTP